MCPLTASKCLPHSLPWCIRTKWRVRGGKAKENCSLNSRIKQSHLNHPAKNHEPARADTHTALIVSHCWTTRTISPVYKKLLLNKLGWGHRNLRIFKTLLTEKDEHVRTDSKTDCQTQAAFLLRLSVPGPGHFLDRKAFPEHTYNTEACTHLEGAWESIFLIFTQTIVKADWTGWPIFLSLSNTPSHKKHY